MHSAIKIKSAKFANHNHKTVMKNDRYRYPLINI